jgi:hypothetical protein
MVVDLSGLDALVTSPSLCCNNISLVTHSRYEAMAEGVKRYLLIILYTRNLTVALQILVEATA